VGDFGGNSKMGCGKEFRTEVELISAWGESQIRVKAFNYERQRERNEQKKKLKLKHISYV